ncbi:hypothetical protein FPQ18DRAFT_418797 [Pyronema domesticum]|nr:hypothetical protein FPQ18DRAFT_418797 [Pyronema domesticum]
MPPEVVVPDIPAAPPSPAPQCAGNKFGSGGDAQGMNAADVNLMLFTRDEGHEDMVKSGNLIKRMTREGWLKEGGILIGTARCMEFRERAERLAGAKNLILNAWKHPLAT